MLKKEDYEPGLWTEEKNLTVEETGLPFTEELAGVIPQPEENREIPDGMKVVPAQNESYQNFIIRYSRNVDGTVNYESDRSFQIINELFGVIYIPASHDKSAPSPAFPVLFRFRHEISLRYDLLIG